MVGGEVFENWKSLGMRAEGLDWPLTDATEWPDFSLWKRVGEVHLPHPAYQSQIHRFDIYQIEEDGVTKVFAFGEMSPGGYAFYIPTDP
jgi:hypothetical protein